MGRLHHALRAASGVSAGMVASYRDAVMADLPLAYLRLDETSGTTAADETGNGHIGSYSGSYTQGASPLIQDGTSIDFSGGHVRVDNSGWMPSGTQEQSHEIWIKANVGADAKLLSRGDPNISGGSLNLTVEGILGDGDWYIVWRHTDGNRSFGPISRTEPAHAVFVIPPNASTTNDPYMIVNGIQTSGFRTGGANQILSITSTDVFLGSRVDSSQPFYGKLDEYSLYDYVLTESQAQSHYNAGIGA